MQAYKLESLVLEASQSSVDGEFLGRRWVEEGGIQSYLEFAKKWVVKAANFMKLRPEDSEVQMILQSCLESYFENTVVSSDTVRFCNKSKNIMLRKDLMKDVAAEKWPKLREQAKQFPNCKFDRNLIISTKLYKHFFEIPVCEIPDAVIAKIAHIIPALNLPAAQVDVGQEVQVFAGQMSEEMEIEPDTQLNAGQEEFELVPTAQEGEGDAGPTAQNSGQTYLYLVSSEENEDEMEVIHATIDSGVPPAQEAEGDDAVLHTLEGDGEIAVQPVYFLLLLFSINTTFFRC